MAKLPTVTSNIPRDLRNYLDRVREALNATGSDELLTVRRLTAIGLLEQSPDGDLSPANASGEYQTPPAPLNFSVDGALANIILTWDAPTYLGHAHTEIWAAGEPVGGGVPALGDALLIGVSPGATFAHNLGQSATRWYWIRFINIAGQAGPYNSVAGTQGTTGQDPAYLLDLLTGEITESQLFNDLAARIDLIDAPASTPGSVNNRVALVQGQVNDLLNLPEWDVATSYAIDDQVVYNGGLYIAIQSSTGVTPPDAAYWTKLGDYTSLGDAVAANSAQINTLDGELGTLVTQTNTLATQLRGDYTGEDVSLVSSGLLHSERQARSSADSALASDISTLTAFTNTRSRVFYQGNEPTTAPEAPLQEGDVWIDTSRNYAPDYVAGDYTAVSNRQHVWDGSAWTQAPDAGIADSFAALNQEKIVRSKADEAIASDVTAIDSRLTDTETYTVANASAISSLDTRVTTAEGVITASASDIVSLDARLTDTETNITGNASAISSLDTRVTSAEGEIVSSASDITALDARLTDTENNTLGNATAISSLEVRVTSSEGSITAQASDITTLQADVAGNTSSIQTESAVRATQTGDLFAQYTVKTDLNGYVSGYGLASTAVDGVPTSEFVVRADSFSIGSPGATTPAPELPFVVITTPVTVNGETTPVGVYLRDAFIQNGTITNAKIGDAAIDTAKIADASIVSAKIGDAQIGTAKIVDAAITSAKIRNAAITNAKIGDAEITNAKIADLDAGKINAGFISSDRIEAESIDASKIDTRGLSIKDTLGNTILSAGTSLSTDYISGLSGFATLDRITSSNVSTYIANAAIRSAQIGDAQITNAKIGSIIQSSNYLSGVRGWRINKDGSAEFNGPVISRQLLVNSGSVYFGYGTSDFHTSFTQEFQHDLEATGVPISAWAGATKSFICNVGVRGSISTGPFSPPDVYWGFTGEILPLTKWSGNQTLRLRLRFYTKKVSFWNNLRAEWRIYEVT